MKVARNIVNTLLDINDMDQDMMGDYRWDDLNSFSFDAQGYVQWFSPASDGDRVPASEAMIQKFKGRGFAVYDRDGYISL